MGHGTSSKQHNSWSASLCSRVKWQNLKTECVWLGESDLSLVSAGFRGSFERIQSFVLLKASLRKPNNESSYVRAKFLHLLFNTSWPNELIVESPILSATEVTVSTTNKPPDTLTTEWLMWREIPLHRSLSIDDDNDNDNTTKWKNVIGRMSINNRAARAARTLQHQVICMMASSCHFTTKTRMLSVASIFWRSKLRVSKPFTVAIQPLSTRLIKPNFCFHSPTDAAPQFL